MQRILPLISSIGRRSLTQRTAASMRFRHTNTQNNNFYTQPTTSPHTYFRSMSTNAPQQSDDDNNNSEEDDDSAEYVEPSELNPSGKYKC